MARARFILLAAGIAGLSILSNVSAEEIKPWEEVTIGTPFDPSKLEGVLDKQTLEELIERGEHLFTSSFTSPDGVGRPMATQAIIPTKRKRPPENAFQRLSGMDANACSSCHNQPIIGGAGDFSANVFVSEGFTNTDFDTSDPQFSNERNTNHLFGAGLIELLAREMTIELHAQRKSALNKARETGKQQFQKLSAKGVKFGFIYAQPDGIIELNGVEGVDTDLVIRPFSQKGVMTSLRQFSINAANHHHGIQANERFGKRWTGSDDFDEDKKANELAPSDVSALVAWQATRPIPFEKIPENSEWKTLAATGSQLFDTLGCNECHRRYLPLDSLSFADPGPFDAAGTLRNNESKSTIYDLSLTQIASKLEKNDKGQFLVPLFGDLKRHQIADQQVATLGNELLSQRFVDRDMFMTSELWGISQTDPYGHRGDLTTLDEVITAHGGKARTSRNAYVKLPKSEKDALIAFLKTLVIE